MHVDVKHGPETVRTTMEDYQTVIAGLVAKYGPWAPGSGSAVKIIETAPVNSTFDKLVVDNSAETTDRVEKLHKAVEEGYGANIRGKAWFADRTRMADSGYATERARDAAHAAKGDARDVLRAFAARIDAEKRKDCVVRAGDVPSKLQLNGKLTFDGLRIRPHAVRGMLARLESSAGRYVEALRQRIGEKRPDQDKDRAELMSVLVRELESNPDVELNFRTRMGLGDIFATVGPGYGNADGNLVAPILADALPDGTKAVVDYDEASTQWHVKASVRTTTDVDKRVISEPTENGLSFRSHDGGGSKLKGGDFLIFLLCLNASIDEVMGTECSLTHRARVLSGLRRMIPALIRGMAIMQEAWVNAAEETVQTECRTDAGFLIPLETVIPGFFRNALTARKGELVGILPGRTENNVATLAATFQTERRNPDTVTRADLGQALTRTVRDLPDLQARTDAQAAIGAWIHRREPVAYAAR